MHARATHPDIVVEDLVPGPDVECEDDADQAEDRERSNTRPVNFGLHGPDRGFRKNLPGNFKSD